MKYKLLKYDKFYSVTDGLNRSIKASSIVITIEHFKYKRFTLLPLIDTREVLMKFDDISEIKVQFPELFI